MEYYELVRRKENTRPYESGKTHSVTAFLDKDRAERVAETLDLLSPDEGPEPESYYLRARDSFPSISGFSRRSVDEHLELQGADRDVDDIVDDYPPTGPVYTGDYGSTEPVESSCGELIEGISGSLFSTARVRIEEPTRAHYHPPPFFELYQVLEGEGELRTRDRGRDEIQSFRLEERGEVSIGYNTVHQAAPLTDSVLVETVNIPPWAEENEFVVEESLF